jgi:hypothetical protein
MGRIFFLVVPNGVSSFSSRVIRSRHSDRAANLAEEVVAVVAGLAEALVATVSQLDFVVA